MFWRIVFLVIAFLAFSGEHSYAEDRSVDASQGMPEIHDPFFEFVIGVVEGDSLGCWSGVELLARMEASGRESRLPVERVAALERRVDLDDPDGRRLRLELHEPLAVSVPWSLLGYHPGSLHISRVIEGREIRLESVPLHIRGSGSRRARTIHVFVLDSGHLVLDVDGVVDRLLGDRLDDTWFTAFVIARVPPLGSEDDLHGLGLGLSRKNRFLVGSFDLRHDEIAPNGLPVPSALARYCRRTLNLPEDRAWTWRP